MSPIPTSNMTILNSVNCDEVSAIGSWNIHNAVKTTNLAEYAKFCKGNGIDFMAVQETKRPGTTIEEFKFDGELLKGWRYAGTGLSKNRGVVGFIMSPNVKKIRIIDNGKVNWGRIISLTCELHNLKLKVCNVYAPHGGLDSSVRTAFWSRLEKCIKKLKTERGQFGLLGDMNAVIGRQDSEDYGDVCGKNIRFQDFSSENGHALMNLCFHQNIRLLNTHFMSKPQYESTFFDQHIKKWKRLDYIGFGRKFMSKLAINCRAETGLSLKNGQRSRGTYTDHNPVILTFKKQSKKQLKRTLKSQSTVVVR